MSRSNAAKIIKRKDSTLLESFGAVQAALEAMPESVFKTASPMADAFLVADPTLASLERQMKDANSQFNSLSHLYGSDDAMVEAAGFQRAQIEQAYAMRLAALRRRRGEQGRSAQEAAANDDELKLQGKNTRMAAPDSLRIQREEEERLLREQQEKTKRNDALWLLALIAFGSIRNVYYQQRPTLGFV